MDYWVVTYQPKTGGEREVEKDLYTSQTVAKALVALATPFAALWEKDVRVERYVPAKHDVRMVGQGEVMVVHRNLLRRALPVHKVKKPRLTR